MNCSGDGQGINAGGSNRTWGEIGGESWALKWEMGAGRKAGSKRATMGRQGQGGPAIKGCYIPHDTTSVQSLILGQMHYVNGEV